MDQAQGKCLTKKLLNLMQETGYPLIQHNGQRKFGPPLDWVGSPPPKGCEIFIGKLPRDVYEDELVPIFSRVGKIYEMRLMMDFSGSNRGYAFLTYATKAQALKAVKELNNFEIQPGKRIGVVKSVDNCRLFVGGIPKDKTKEDILEELSKRVSGIVDVILHNNCYDKKQNRGFAFVEFTSHKAAAMARRSLLPGCIKLWDCDVMVDWAEPEPHVDDEQMLKVKVLYARNFEIKTSPQTIQDIFESAINSKIEHIKKIYDYAFIHFYERKHAELAMQKLQNSNIDGATIEIKWAKPVDREMYRIQKMNKGNAKFNHNILNFSQTLMLYKQHLEKKEYATASGSGSGWSVNEVPNLQKPYILPPARLDAMCKRNMWALPIYDYQKYIDRIGREFWIGKVLLPHVGLPLLTTPRSLGPLLTPPCSTMQEAHVKAADCALHFLKNVQYDLLQRSTISTIPTMFSHIPPPVPTCVGLPCEYVNTPVYQTAPQPMTLPVQAVWRNV